jgi:hypothetical protein
MDYLIDVQSKDKLAECNYFLNKLQKYSYHDIEGDFYYSAFVIAWRSFLDVLLYDAAIQFNLGFYRDERMYPKHFRDRAQKLGNKKAIEFLNWWEQKVAYLSSKDLANERHVFVHRGASSRMIYLPATISMDWSGGFRNEHFGNGFNTSKDRRILSGLQSQDTAYVQEEMVIRCEEKTKDSVVAYKEIKEIVNDACTTFFQ